MIWTPDICIGEFNERCKFEWFEGDTWNPIGKWRFISSCAEHSKYPDDEARLQALKDEQLTMSKGRGALAKELNLKYPDGSPDLNGDTIDFSYDEDRKLKLSIPKEKTDITLSDNIEVEWQK